MGSFVSQADIKEGDPREPYETLTMSSIRNSGGGGGLGVEAHAAIVSPNSKPKGTRMAFSK